MTSKAAHVCQPHCPEASRGYLALLVLVVMVLVGALLYHLHVRFEAIELGYETSKARAVRTRLLREQRELRLELASLKEPGRIELEAKEKLEMEVPDQNRIVPIGKQVKTIVASGKAL